MKRYIIIIFIPLLFSCWLNPNAPANVFECNKGNVQGEDLAKCRKDVKNFYQLILAALSNAGGGGTVKVTEYVYTGTLTDSTGKPLSNTVIKSEPPGLEGTTDANGNYQFTGSPGTYTVTVYNSDGSESGKLQVDISNGGQTTVVVISGDVTMNVSVGYLLKKVGESNLYLQYLRSKRLHFPFLFLLLCPR